MFKKEIFNWILLEKIFVICWKILLNFTRFLFGSKLHFFVTKSFQISPGFQKLLAHFIIWQHLPVSVNTCLQRRDYINLPNFPCYGK